ncbi:MAG: flagellar assembly protein FliH [Sporolactobacillus sp.]
MSNLIKSPGSSHIHKTLKLTTVIDPMLDALTDTMNEAEVQKTLDDKINQAKKKAAEIIEQARKLEQGVRQKLADEEQLAKEQNEAAFKQKEKEGFAAGHQKGLAQGKADYDQRIAQANQIVNQIHDTYVQTVEKAQPDILKLALAVAGKIIGEELSGSEDRWMDLVSQAVKEVRDQGNIKITVAPERHKQIEDSRHLLDGLVQDQKIYIYSDTDYAFNDCTVETAFGKIDAGTESQLNVIHSKLQQIMDGEAK